MRLFVAVEVPAEVREAVAVAVEPLRASAPRLRWVDPARYHLTLVFLGEVADGALPAIASVVDEACGDVTAFSLRLDGTVGTFGRRVLWAGVEQSDQLAALAAVVRAVVGGIVHLPDGERAFSAHLTLARAGRRQPVRAAALLGASVPRMSWRVQRAVLMRSAGGYSVERAFDLRDANA